MRSSTEPLALIRAVTASEVPVKFTLAVNRAATCHLPPATISLSRTAGGTIGPIDENVYQISAENGSNSRVDSTACQYVYNLGAKSLGVGTYSVKITINNSALGDGAFGLR